MAADLHSATLYANACDLSLFLFDSRNYYMDCIRMDEIIFYALRRNSAARNRFSFSTYSLVSFYVYVRHSLTRFFFS